MEILKIKLLNNNNLTFVAIIFIFNFITSCLSAPTIVRGPTPVPVSLPFLRLGQGGECYFIDDFLPTPDSLVTGKTTGLYLRYYTYWNAQYKNWYEVGIMLSFYSNDNRCWSLFEEYVMPTQNDDFSNQSN